MEVSGVGEVGEGEGGAVAGIGGEGLAVVQDGEVGPARPSLRTSCVKWACRGVAEGVAARWKCSGVEPCAVLDGVEASLESCLGGSVGGR
ncbi:MAG: hypothetical protein H6736_13445 [Alphaproteobacteria bacterium]|nr:hypothetical protein [Alphaproteobacteria bacterium]